MKLIKDGNIVNFTDEFVIGIYKENGWEEVTEETKEEVKITPEVEEVKEIPKELPKTKRSKK